MGEGGHAGRLPATVAALRGLHGLPGTLADAIGRDIRELATKRGFLDACAAARALPSGADAVPTLVPVRKGGVIVGHAPRGRDDALRIASLASLGHTMDVRVTGGVSRKACGATGLRIRRRRPWARDPSEDAALASLSDRILDAWSARFVPGGPGLGFVAAVVTPYVAGGCSSGIHRALAALVVISPSPCRAVRLGLGPESHDAGAPTRERLAGSISAALSGGYVEFVEYAPWVSPSYEGVQLALAAMDVPFPVRVPVPRNDGEIDHRRHAFGYRVARLLALGMRAAMANLRKALPPYIAQNAGLSGMRFEDPRAAWKFMSKRAGWEVTGFERANQAARLVPWLRTHMDDPSVSGPILSGAPIEMAVRAVTGCASPLHPKVVRSLSGLWRRDTYLTLPQERAQMRVAVTTLEAAFRANPHLRPFRTAEVARMLKAFKPFRDALPADAATRAAILLSLRDPAGTVRLGPHGLKDMHAWVRREIAFLLEGTGHGSEADVEAAVRAALYPPRRTVSGLETANRSWHAAVGGYATARHAFLTSAGTAHEETGHPVLYPHVIYEPVSIEGVVLVPLRSQVAILREGQEMHHCVASYARRSMAGTCFLLGLSSCSGRSTAEVILAHGEAGAPLPRVAQHRSHSNATPPPLHVQALETLMGRLREGGLEALPDRVREAGELAARTHALETAGLGPRDLGLLMDLVFEQVRPFLAGVRHDETRDGWLGTLAPATRPMAA